MSLTTTATTVSALDIAAELRLPPPTAEQQEVIEATPEHNVIVNAPPGTGKTFVACRRIERLLDHGVAPSRIWMISFTRTAAFALANLYQLRHRLAIVGT